MTYVACESCITARKPTCVTHSDHVLGSLELPEGDIDGDTTLTLGLQLVQDPGYGKSQSLGCSTPADSKGQLTVFEGTLAELSGFLFELFDGTFVDATALVDQVPGSSRLSGIDVSDDCEKDGRTLDWVWRSERSADRNAPTTLTWVFSFPIFEIHC